MVCTSRNTSNVQHWLGALLLAACASFCGSAARAGDAGLVRVQADDNPAAIQNSSSHIQLLTFPLVSGRRHECVRPAQRALSVKNRNWIRRAVHGAARPSSSAPACFIVAGGVSSVRQASS